jgi:FkbM family methyltransferase
LHPFEKPKDITSSKIAFYQKVCQKGDMIIDIGAHTGDTTVPMALCVGKEGIVLGLEPNKYVYKILEKNTQLNKELTNIVPLQFAATPEDGEFTFNYSDASFCNGGFLSEIESNSHKHNYTLNVVGKNFQKFLLEHYEKDLDRLSLLKVDAEGYDKEILKTLPEIINRSKPALMIECYNKLNVAERNDLFDVVSGFGYHLFYLDDFESYSELKEIKRENMSDWKHYEILALHESKKDGYDITYK